MSISKHVKSLQKHLAQFGLYQVPEKNTDEESAIFKICFLNHNEMQRWKELNERKDNHNELLPLKNKN
ncbi:hypothetical protein SAMN05518672_109168 [Chitinophaga sp. CF118]|uniref:hypothetical protein n=1 Tax=Chitinophaga sp. CF118 TaxID=1884367 RepID=UPI0008E26A8E|nr:hypothetical protein [Chitinophaga sp. CF118]SFE71705.1 hypothetical protein SAMN05518672_109168 [Chitinophaga sp. CF118]